MNAIVVIITNEFRNTVNIMVTSLTIGVPKPRVAVAISGVLSLVGAFLSAAVAETVSSGLTAELLDRS